MPSKEVRTVLEADDRTRAGIESAKRGMKGYERETITMANRIGSALRTIGPAVLAGAAAFGYMVKQSLNTASRLADVADKVGQTTDDLQALRYAAEQSGVDVRTLDMAMQRFSRRVAEVAQGQGELLKTAQQYDIQVRDSEGNIRSNMDILRDFTNVIANAESEQEQLRIAFKLFDSEGAAVVNMLKDGSGGLDAMMQRAHELGIVIDENLIRRGKEANDRLDEMNRVLSAQKDTLILELAPAIANFAENWVAGFLKIKRALSEEGSIDREIARQQELLEGYTESLARQKAKMAGEAGLLDSLLTGPATKATIAETEEEIARIMATIDQLRAEQAALQGPTGEDVSPRVMREQQTLEQLSEMNLEYIEARRGWVETRLQQDEEEAEKRARIAQQTESFIQSQNQNTFNNALNLLRMMGREHKGLALAALALEKAQSIAKIVISARAAEMKAMEYDGGGPWSTAMIARIKTMEALNIGIVGATGLMQAAGMSGGGGGGGGYGGGGTATEPTTATQPAPQAAPAQTALYININTINTLATNNEELGRQLAPIVKDAVGNGEDFGMVVVTSGGKN